MTDHRDDLADRPGQLAWVQQQLRPGEHILRKQELRGGITTEMSRLTVGEGNGGQREAAALLFLAGTAIPAPALVAVDPSGADCEYPSLMTYMPGGTVLAQEGIEARVPLLASHLVAIHGRRPAERPPLYQTLTTPDTVVVPAGADAACCTARSGVCDLRRLTSGPAARWRRRHVNGVTG